MRFKLGQRVRYSKIYVPTPFKNLPEDGDEPIRIPRKDIKEIPTREGIICGIRRVAMLARADFYDSGNDEHRHDHWEVVAEGYKMVYLVAPNMSGLNKVDEDWLEAIA